MLPNNFLRNIIWNWFNGVAFNRFFLMATLFIFYFAYIKLNKVSHNGAHLTLDIMLLPLLTRNLCIYLLNVFYFCSFSLFLFTIPNTRQIYIMKIHSKTSHFWETGLCLMRDRKKRTNYIYIMDQDGKICT